MNKKFGICIGINDYPGTNNDLSGCVNDANDWADMLEARNVAVDVLTDSQATKANIVAALREGISITGYRDTLYVTFSGHGSYVPDYSGDEIDGRDEVLCAYDFQNNGLISDDELFDIFSTKRFGARVVFFSDSCHSGSVNRFLQMPTAGRALKTRYMPPTEFLEGEQLRRAMQAQNVRATEQPRAGAVLISGCNDFEYSYDAWFNVNGQWRANGAFTYTALKQFSAGQNYKQWHQAIRTKLPSSDYPQAPQLDGRWYQKRWKAL